MTSLALINEFLGMPPNASQHGYQIDHIIEFCHWFMGALFVGWSAFFLYVLWRFRKKRNPTASHEGVTSGISTHSEFAVVLIEAVLLIGFAIPLWAKRVNAFPPDKDAIHVGVEGQQFSWNFHLPGRGWHIWPARCPPGDEQQSARAGPDRSRGPGRSYLSRRTARPDRSRCHHRCDFPGRDS